MSTGENNDDDPPSDDKSAVDLSESKASFATLTSPSVGAFAPGLENDPHSNNSVSSKVHHEQQPHSFHGLGLRLSLDRSKKLYHRNCELVDRVAAWSRLYQQTGASLHDALQTLEQSPALSQHGNHGDANNLLGQEWRASVRAWSRGLLKQSPQLAILAKQMGAWQQHADHGTRKACHQIYWETRKHCCQARSDGTKARQRWQHPKPTDTSTSRLERYRRAVRREHYRVRQCEQVEKYLLETLEMLERDSHRILAQSVVQCLQTEQQACEESATGEDDGESAITPQHANRGNGEKGSANGFRNFLASSGLSQLVDPATSTNMNSNSSLQSVSASNPTSAQNETVLDGKSASLLPDDLLKLREQIRSEMDQRSIRVQQGRALSAFFQAVAASSAKLSNGLLQLVPDDDENDDDSGIVDANEGDHGIVENPCTETLLDSLLSVFQDQAEEAIGVATALKNVCTKKLAEIIIRDEKACKTTSDTEVTMWNQLCLAARQQHEAEEIYRQSLTETVKARARVESVDMDHGTSATPDQKLSPLRRSSSNLNNSPIPENGNNTSGQDALSKGLANMFSILPDGGDHAMRIFNPSVRASMAQQNLEQADEKQLKGRQKLDAAVEATARAMEAYQLNTQALFSQCKEDEKTGQTDTNAALDEMGQQVERLRQSRLDVLARARARNGPTVTRNVQKDIDEWIIRTQHLIQSKLGGSSVECDDYLYTLPMPEVLQKGDEEETVFVVGEEETEAEDQTDTSATRDSPEIAEAVSTNSATESSQNDDESSLSWLRRRSRSRTFSQTSSYGSVPSSMSFAGIKQSGSKKSWSDDRSKDEADILLAYFWPDTEPQNAPDVVDSFSCSVRDGGHKFPHHYGRMYIAKSHLIFVSWTGKRLLLSWPNVLAVKASRRSLAGASDSIRIMCRTSSGEESCLMLGGISDRDKIVPAITETRVASLEEFKATNVAKEASTAAAAGADANKALVEVPPDKTLEKMEVIFTKPIRNTSICRFYEIAWSEGQGTSEEPIYKPWLDEEAFEIEMGNWSVAPVTGSWCGEQYSQSRTIKFKIQRKTHLYIGPPIANVRQTHYCRVEGEDRCVVGMTVEMEGIPYSDCFAVEVRWVARRTGVKDIEVQVGVFVNFKKNTLLKSKIRSGTIEETAPAHKRLFEKVRTACSVAAGENSKASDDLNDSLEDVDGETSSTPQESGPSLFLDRRSALAAILVVITLTAVIRWLRKGESTHLVEDSPLSEYEGRLVHLEQEVRAVHGTLKEILAVLKEQQHQC